MAKGLRQAINWITGAILMSPGLAMASVTVHERYRWIAFLVFGTISAITMYITYVAATRVKSASDFYTASSQISGIQNAWAIAGDYLSAASLLGVTGLIALWGFDGFMYSIGWLVAYVTILLLIAEPCRNIGKYTLADILAYRNNPKATRIIGALSTVTVSTFYLTAQMVGGGILIKTLVGVDYEISVVAVGILMLGYVLFGGMLATTWVQMTKAFLLVVTSFVLVCCIWLPYGFSLPSFLQDIANSNLIQQRVATILNLPLSEANHAELGELFLLPGLLQQNPLDQLSLGLALVFGTAGLPHILMRFFTVPTARDARKSVMWAMLIIGAFYLMTLFLGLGAALHVGPDRIKEIDSGGNMATPLLALYLGGGIDSFYGNLLLAFIAAVAFATIVAVVAGLVLAASSAMAHDVYVGVIRGEHASTEEQIKAARIATVVFGVLAILIGITAKGQNVAHLVALAFAIAASANFPCILLTLYWKRCNTGGIVAGMVTGLISAITLVLISPNMTYPKARVERAQDTLSQGQLKLVQLEKSLLQAQRQQDLESIDRHQHDKLLVMRENRRAQLEIERFKGSKTSLVGLSEPLYPLRNPGILSIPLGFLAVILGSLLYRRDQRATERWHEMHVRQHTGVLAFQRDQS